MLLHACADSSWTYHFFRFAGGSGIAALPVEPTNLFFTMDDFDIPFALRFCPLRNISGADSSLKDMVKPLQLMERCKTRNLLIFIAGA
jgi:hypothetical protein